MPLGTELVITGCGAVSPLGIGRQGFWESLQSGRSGVRTLDSLRDTVWPVRFGGEVLDFEAKKFVKPRKSLKVMCREIQMGFAAAALALDESQLDTDAVESERFGVLSASELFYCEPEDVVEAVRNCVVDGEYHDEMWGDHALPHLYPLWMLMYLPNMIACHLAIAYQALAPNNTITVGDASGVLAMAEAADIIDRGRADVMIVCGAGSRIGTASMLYHGRSGLSQRNDNPEGASRPFEKSRDGMVNAEGAAAFILERRSHAEGRGAPILASVAGFGRSFGVGRAEPQTAGDGLRRAIRIALESAEIEPAALSHVNPNGLSTRDGDRIEAAALRDTLGDTPVVATKSNVGNIGAGCGVLEVVATVSALHAGQTPATLNYDEPDEDCPVNVNRETTDSTADYALSVNSSAAGQAAAVVLRRES